MLARYTRLLFTTLAQIPRSACSPREHIRSGDIWRLVQEAAVDHSVACGWPPSRYKAQSNGWVVRELFGVHHQELIYPDSGQLELETWIANNKRQLLFRRETRIPGVFAGSVDWVFVGPDKANWGPTPCPPELARAFGIEHHENPTRLPILPPHPTPLPGPDFQLEPWYIEVDPQGHTNHPRYVDWAEETLCRWLVKRGQDPLLLVAAAERARFRSEARAGDKVLINISELGQEGNLKQFEIKMWREPRSGEDQPVRLGEVLLIRKHPDWL